MNEFEMKNTGEGLGNSEEAQRQFPQPPQMPPMPEETVTEEKENIEVEEVQNNETEIPQNDETEETPNVEKKAEPEQNSNPYGNYTQYQPPRPPYGQPPYQGHPGYNGYPQGGYQPPQGGYQGSYVPPQYGNPNPYAQPYSQQQVPPEHFNNMYQPEPPKQKMNGGLKALIIIIIAILVACVLGFNGYLYYNYESNKKQNPNSSNSIFGGDYFGGFGDFGDGFGATNPTIPALPQEQSSGETYEQSDAKDKIDADYKGIELKEKPHDNASTKYNASYTFEAVQKSVVGVACYYNEDKGTDNYRSQGTGIIVRSDGYIITNAHVIGNSRKAYLIKVITADKKEYDAGVVGYDSRSDLAVLKIDAKNLPVAQFGNSDLTKITDEVVAIGNPSGIEFQNSVTKGIVSALDRKVSTSNNVKFIQIDAAINPGNSGGPLCNMYGQVIGINTAKIASEAYEGMGFAIPSVTAKKIVDDIIKHSYVTNRVKVGITGQAVLQSNAGANGIQIVEISPDGPMDGTDAQVGDIITAVDGQETTTFAEIYDVLEKHKEGDKVKVKLYRPSHGKNIEIEITLQIDKAEN